MTSHENDQAPTNLSCMPNKHSVAHSFLQSADVNVWYAEDMWQYLSELGVQQREVHFKLGKVEDEIKTLVQKK